MRQNMSLKKSFTTFVILSQVLEQDGFDEKFIRTWEYYFDYMGAGFKCCLIGNYQVYINLFFYSLIARRRTSYGAAASPLLHHWRAAISNPRLVRFSLLGRQDLLAATRVKSPARDSISDSPSFVTAVPSYHRRLPCASLSALDFLGLF